MSTLGAFTHANCKIDGKRFAAEVAVFVHTCND